MIVRVDQDLCIGCGLCTTECPKIFEMVDDKAQVIVSVVPVEGEECCKLMVDACPVNAISVIE
jgi:ferredoxin